MNFPDERRSLLYAYMKVDEDNLDGWEPGVIDSLVRASIAYLKRAGIEMPKEPYEMDESESSVIDADSYWLVVNAMTLYAYDNRTAVGFVPEGVRGLLNQMKLEANYS